MPFVSKPLPTICSNHPFSLIIWGILAYLLKLRWSKVIQQIVKGWRWWR
jgi:hypothetical protein